MQLGILAVHDLRPEFQRVPSRKPNPRERSCQGIHGTNPNRRYLLAVSGARSQRSTPKRQANRSYYTAVCIV